MDADNSKTIDVTYGQTVSLDKLLDGVADFLMAAFFGAAFIYYFVSFGFGKIRLVLLIMAGAAGFLNYIYKQQVSRTVLAYFALAVLSFMICLSFDANYNYGISKFICTVSYMGIALNLLSHGRRPLLYEILFYAVSAFVLFRIHILGVAVRDIIQDGSSRNYISVYALFFFLSASIMRVQEGKKVSLIQSLVFLVVAFSAYGRGGMLTGILLVFGVLFIHVLEKKSSWKIILLAVIGTLLVMSVVFWNPLLVLLNKYFPFFRQFSQRAITVDNRLPIWSAFLKNNGKSLQGFLLGSDPVLARADGNLHNSFLQMYSSFGLIFFAINIVLTVYAIFFYYKKDKWMLLLFVVLLSRAMTDRLFYHGINECLYYYFIFALLTGKTCLEENFRIRRKWKIRLSSI